MGVARPKKREHALEHFWKKNNGKDNHDSHSTESKIYEEERKILYLGKSVNL